MIKRVLSVLLVLIMVLTAFPLTALSSFAAAKNGFVKSNGNIYYYKDNVKATGWQSIQRANGKTYMHYFSKDGVMLTGWQSIKNRKGVAYKYHFLDNGIMETGLRQITNTKGVTHTYYFGDNGWMRTGWQYIKRGNGKTYRHYFNQYGAMYTGWHSIKRADGKTYRHYFNQYGILLTGWQKIKNSKGNELWYYFLSNGTMATGWRNITNSKGDTNRFYFGDNGVMRKGFQSIKNAKGVPHTFYFGDNGIMRKGWQEIKRGNGNTYKHYFNTYGVMLTGWQKIKNEDDDNVRRYYFGDNGCMRTGWVKIDDTWRFFDENGAFVPGWNNEYATFSCNYVYDPNRTNNLRVASNFINGTILQPGDVFDFNKIVGPRTYARGFKDAGVFSGNEIVMGVGGGICHVSTTVFNCALRANMEILERHQHSMKVAYVPAGTDATIYQNSCNLRFKNTTGKTVKMFMSVKDGVISCSMYTYEYAKPPKVTLDVTYSGGTYTLRRYADGVCNYTTRSTY